MDQKGFVFSIDAFISLIIIVLILGISADAMDIAGNKILDFSSEQSYERIIGDVADVLVTTSGSPENWEKMSTFGGVTPGLMDNKNQTHGVNKLSMMKINCLRSHPELIKKIIPYGFDCSITIYPMDPTLPTISLINEVHAPTSEVYVVNRTVVYSYDSYVIYSSIKMENYVDKNSYDYKCPHIFLSYLPHQSPDFKISKPGWICSEFKVKLADINSTDFYLLTDPPVLIDEQALWMIDRPDNITENAKKFTNQPIDIKSKIKEQVGDDGVMVLHVYTSGDNEKLFNVYLIGVPSGTPINDVKVNFIGVKHGYFILNIWD